MRHFTDHLVIRRPETRNSIDWRVQKGRLVPVLPGVYRPRDMEETFEVRVAAVAAKYPHALIGGAAAAKILWWPEIQTDLVHVYGARVTNPPKWLRPFRGKIPADLVTNRGEIMLANRALSTLQATEIYGGKAIDESLRLGASTIADLRTALEYLPVWPGKQELRRLVVESRDSPWSPLERQGHIDLRAARITGWETNYKVVIDGEKFFIDVTFPKIKLAVELDGFEHHSTPEAMTRDRRRQNALVKAGWTVLRFTWGSIDDLVPDVLHFLPR